MDKKIGKTSKDLKTFWPLFIIFTVAVLLGGTILGVAYSNIIQDEVYSLNFKFHRAEPVNTKPAITKKTNTQAPK